MPSRMYTGVWGDLVLQSQEVSRKNTRQNTQKKVEYHHEQADLECTQVYGEILFDTVGQVLARIPLSANHR